ncbi:MAG: nucleotidyltransferase family protein [Oscillospiraceae bacterium]|jgi:predicted nucleotidyltransferase|nr:nucleotidyltransferase family protein [Oscillospiraceae bacterium]
MIIVGIAAEYNPFHSGHAEHLARTREAVGADSLIVVVMSGNFVQRGDIAVYSKRARANAAVHSGADIVLELPAAVSLSSAKYFAKGAVNLLNALGRVDYLSFGSESGDLTELAEIAALLDAPAVDELIRSELTLGVSYAAARQSALECVSGKTLDWLRLPNNILAVEYLAALKDTTIKPLTIKRGDSEDTASALRQKLKAGAKISAYTPKSAKHIYAAEERRGAGPVFTDSIEQAVLTKLKAMTTDDFSALPDASEGLGNRFYNAVQTSQTLDELLNAVKTKRYAMSRLRRMAFCAFLGIRASDRLIIPEKAVVLASSKRGREFNSALPLVTGSSDTLYEWLTDKV